MRTKLDRANQLEVAGEIRVLAEMHGRPCCDLGLDAVECTVTVIRNPKVQLRFEMRRPPLEATPASRRLAAHGAAIYEELGLPLKVLDVASGGGTDAAFAALKTTAPVIEGFGLSSYGAHSNDAEYVKLESIVPRLYLSARMIMDVSQDRVK